MQKIFIRYFLLIMVVTVSITLLCSFFVQTGFSEKHAEQEGAVLIKQIRFRFMENAAITRSLVTNLNENYVSRARALAEIIAQTPSILESLSEMERLVELLRVDEIHVTNEAGVLRWGNVPAYYGFDFSSSDQTRPFLTALVDKRFALAQNPRPNGMEGKPFQYIGVARQDKAGIVQVGVVPEVMDAALVNNRIDVVIAGFNVTDGINVIALDKNTGIVVGDSKRKLVGKSYQELGLGDAFSKRSKTCCWMQVNGEMVYAVFGEAVGYRMLVTFTQKSLFAEQRSQLIVAATSSVLLGLAIIAAIFFLLKQKIIGDVSLVNDGLRKITDGDLDEVVDAKSTPEFAVLSCGINEMVGSLKQQMGKIVRQSTVLEQQAAALQESNCNILASLNYARKIQNNLLPSPKAFEETFTDSCVLWEPRDVVGGDIYWLKRFPAGAVLCVCDCTGHGTPGALLTMLVVSALDTIVHEEICHDPAEILWQLEQRLVNVLNVTDGERDCSDIRDGADLAILFIQPDGNIVLASAKLHVFMCDGKTADCVKGQRLSIGDGSLQSPDQIKTVRIPAREGACYYIVSDGLFEQVGGAGKVPFGYSRFKQLILEHHGRSQADITQAIWNAFETYMEGENRRDDVTLVSFRVL
ncbi:MAG: SpoIIE family protein phosphatase [Candidatus Pelethousia sp.]|nr:SpoIIE family protein phosphatase [Candidatus Pelethousia sp.]